MKYTSKETDSNGRYVFKDLAYGTYTLREKKAPEGYNLSNQEYEVVIKQGMKEEELTQRIIFKNTKIRGNIEFAKLDEDKEPLQGAIFGLFKENETDYIEDNALRTATSNSEGIVKFEDVEYET